MPETWERMTDRERDAWICECLMGGRRYYGTDGSDDRRPYSLVGPSDALDEWEKKFPPEEPNGTDPLPYLLPHYTTDPAADYKVLVRVRDDWSDDQRWKYHRELQGILVLRSSVWTVLNYEPGDYSKAAYLAMGGD